MRLGSEVDEPKGAVYSKDINDSRIIPSRRWMRRCGFDELPQIANIIRGDMVFFGARPMNLKAWSLLTPRQRARRLEHKPGCFGPYSMLRDKRGENLVVANDLFLKVYTKKLRSGGNTLYIFYLFVIFRTLVAILKGKVK